MRGFMVIVALAFVLVIAGCGQKGELYREPASKTADEETQEEED